MEKKYVGLGVGTGAGVIAGIAITILLMAMFTPTFLNLFGSVGVDFETYSVHSRIRMYQNGALVFDEYHAGAVTYIGRNQTLLWTFGNSSFDSGTGDYMNNVTYISIGNQGSLSLSSTQLPGEWNRTLAAQEDLTQSQLNLTCTFEPNAGGPYTADCIGLNWASSGNLNLWGYDTFSEVTGIDETFTINIEFQVSVTSS